MNKNNLPKDALQRITIGQSFAEYDLVRKDPQIFVTTAASLAAEQTDAGKCFFIGRRGAGKTAITYHLSNRNKRTHQLIPQVFDLIKLPLEVKEFSDTRQRPFKSLTACFERALLNELIRHWVAAGIFHFGQTTEAITRERNLIEGCDFDQRVLSLIGEIFDAYKNSRDKLWLRQINRSKELIDEINRVRENSNHDYVFLIDRIDESWDGSDSSIIALRALLHACVRIAAHTPSLRVCVFLRENIFDRVRDNDNEFGRLETGVVYLNWTEEKLTEFVERRLNRPFNTKFALGGATWSAFFDDPNGELKNKIFSLCQRRPRDILTFISYAIEAGVGAGHQQINALDISTAQKRFSLSRLKELGDEYAENYPNISIILNYFFGLSTEYTLQALEQFTQRLLTDKLVKEYCGKWFFEHSAPHLFIQILFNIGFLGIRSGDEILFRGAEENSTLTLKIDRKSTFIIHPSYADALSLRELVLTELSDDRLLKIEGILEDLPDGFTFAGYQQDLKKTLEELNTLPEGTAGAAGFEDVIYQTVKLCFFRSLTNVERKSRTHSGVTIRDIVASNRAAHGFWQMIRNRYSATQIVFECKNYSSLGADDFHQLDYYISKAGGSFVIVVYRSNELDDRIWEHIKRISERHNGALVLPILEKDIKVFLRQAMNGKTKEDHINEIYDRAVRTIS